MGGRGSSSSNEIAAVSRLRESDWKYSKSTNNDSISRKQAGAIYRNVKEGNFEASESAVNFLYNRLASYSPTPTTNQHDSDIASKASSAVEATFKGDYQAAARWYNSAVSTYFHYYSDSIHTGKKEDYYIKAKKR